MPALDQIEAQIICPGAQISGIALLNYALYKRVQSLLITCPDILDEEEQGLNLAKFIAEVECGNFYGEYDRMRVEAMLAMHQYDCDREVANAEALETILYTGIYTSDGVDVAQDVALPGVVATDVVVVTLHTQAGTEVITKAVTGVDKITITFSEAPTVATKVNYTVTRPAA